MPNGYGPGHDRGRHPDERDRGDEAGASLPLSFVVCVSDDAVLETNLLASPCLASASEAGARSGHEIIAIRGAPSAAAGLNQGLERARNELVVCVHQDVHLSPGWDRRAVEQIRIAEAWFGPIGVAGVYGVGEVLTGPGGEPVVPRVGRVVDRNRLIDDGPERPARVATLDELLLIVPRDLGLRFDPALGFHLYGADVCLQVRERGLAVVAIEAPCWHASRSIGLPPAFFESARVFAGKWRHRLPVATPCVLFGGEGRMSVLGNAENKDRSGLARAMKVGQAFQPDAAAAGRNGTGGVHVGQAFQ
ncbi:MAG: glycosyltransferase, partial [Isosphaeraceae bacterium]